MKVENKTESKLQQIIIYGSGLSGGALAALLQSFRGGMSFAPSIFTVVAAVAGFAAFVLFWKLLFLEHRDKRAKILLASITILLIAGGLTGVLYPLKYVAKNEFPNLVTGIVAAVFALSGAALLLWSCKRFLDADERLNDASVETPVVEEK